MISILDRNNNNILCEKYNKYYLSISVLTSLYFDQLVLDLLEKSFTVKIKDLYKNDENSNFASASVSYELEKDLDTTSKEVYDLIIEIINKRKFKIHHFILLQIKFENFTSHVESYSCGCNFYLPSKPVENKIK